MLAASAVTDRDDTPAPADTAGFTRFQNDLHIRFVRSALHDEFPSMTTQAAATPESPDSAAIFATPPQQQEMPLAIVRGQP
ncbi:MAG TPA: hypothetical protein VLK26_09040, partial [Rudaea sp.]|nr:hypothetical protein [Rudaea sp.]